MSNNHRFYQLLGISKNASDAQIKKAYRAAALKNHPDKGGDPEIFKEISMAYETLSDSEKKHIYDQYGEEGLKKGGKSRQNYNNPFNMFTDMFGNGFNFVHQRSKQKQKQKCPNINKTFTLTLEEIYRGIIARISSNYQEICTKCKGKGIKDGVGASQCSSCQGQGSKVFLRMIRPGIMQQVYTSCDQCNSTGKHIPNGNECTVCHGNQTVQSHKNMNLNLPAGISSKDTIIIQGQGHQHPDKIPGDIKIQIQEHPHPIFKRNGNDLIVEKTINLLDAISGFQFPLIMLDGKEKIIQCHSIINSHKDSTKILINQGIPHRNNSGIKGSLIFKFQVEYPTHILTNMNDTKTLAEHLQMSGLMAPINLEEKGDILRI